MSPNLESAAIVCEHVAQGAPILYAMRDQSLEIEDSGWQFLCNKVADEDTSKAQIWLLREVIDQEPSLLDYLLLPPKAEVWRRSVSESWKTSENASD